MIRLIDKFLFSRLQNYKLLWILKKKASALGEGFYTQIVEV
jgi:hypothetical protein